MIDNNVIDMFKRYFKKINNNIQSNNVDINDLPAYIALIGEAFPFLDNKEKWLENSYLLLMKVREEINSPRYYPSIGVFGGLGEVLVALRILYRKSGKYKKFLESLEILIYSITNSLVDDYIQEYKDVQVNYYDLISGLTGIGMYILWKKESKITIHECILLKKILSYFVKLSTNAEGHQYWCIRSENYISEIEKDYTEGYIDFGMAHGIIAPLQLMSEAYNRNIVISNQIESMHKILSIYKDFKTDINGAYNWPSQIDTFNYNQVNSSYVDRRDYRVSWCYGNIGISRALYNIGKNLGCLKLQEFANLNIINIAKMPIDLYKLDTLILCHGYCGLMTILNTHNLEVRNTEIQNRVMELLSLVLDRYKQTFSNIANAKEYAYVNQILNGEAGVILSLLSLYSRNTLWERWLYIV